MALSITLVGTRRPAARRAAARADVRAQVAAGAELLALAQPSAPQPDVVVLDMRETSALPPTLATLRRQHPTTGVVIVAARLDPALMLEAMRAGVNEWVVRPGQRRDLNAAVERVSSARPSSVAGADLRVRRRQGRRRHDDDRRERRDGAGAGGRGRRTLLMDLHLSYGDAAVFLGAEPRFSVADAMENTHRLDEAFFESLVVQTKRRRASAGLGGARGGRGRPAAHRDAAAVRARTTGTRSSTCRARKPRRSTRSRAWRRS